MFLNSYLYLNLHFSLYLHLSCVFNSKIVVLGDIFSRPIWISNVLLRAIFWPPTYARFSTVFNDVWTNVISWLPCLRSRVVRWWGWLTFVKPMALKELWQIMAKLPITLSWKHQKCWQLGLNFTLPKFQEDVMEHLGDRAHYTNLGSCSTKTLSLPKATLQLLETLAV